MDYTHLLNELEQATLFDLYRLHVAIGNELANPDRLAALKRQLTVGMELSYFNPTDNRAYAATLLELSRKKVVVLEHEHKRCVTVPYCMLNMDNVDTEIYARNSEPLTANNLKVGDCVGFMHGDESIVGTVKRLNQKTVTLVTATHGEWRVAYSYLYRVYDAQAGMPNLLTQ